MNRPTLSIRVFALVVFLLVLCLASGCQQQPTETMTEQEAKALLDRYMEIFNKGNLALADEVFHPEFVLKTPLLPKPLVGIEAFEDLVTNNAVAFPDFNGTIEEVVVKGDRIWSRFTMAGTNTGPLGKLPPTGKKIHVTGMAITRVVDGKIVEDQTFWNVFDFYQQLGFKFLPPQVEGKE